MKPTARHLPLVLLAALLAACTSSAPPAPVATPAHSPAAASSPVPSQALPDDVVWVRDSAEYAAAVAQAYVLAGRRIDALAADRQPGTWAVALDVDETVLSNVQHEVDLETDNTEFGDAAWRAWVGRRAATVLPGAIPFLEHVHRLGGRIALVTNRDEVDREPTDANLRAQGVPFDLLLLRPRPDQGAKGPRFEAVQRGTAAPGVPPLDILLWVGDNIRDFPGLDQSLRAAGFEAFAPFGDRFVILPNPMYGSWKRSVTTNTTPSAGKVYVDDIQALLEKSLPARLEAHIRGSLADGCTHLGTPSSSRAGDTFHVTLPATRDNTKACTEALVPFGVTVPIDVAGLPRGTYSLEAGGKTTTFTLSQNN